MKTPSLSSILRFRNRVQVWAFSTDRYLFSCPAYKAKKLCDCGVAMVPEEDRKLKRYWRLYLIRTPVVQPCGPPSILTPNRIKGSEYVYREHLCGQYYLVQFKRIHSGDRWAFCLAVTDNLVSRKPRRVSV